MFETFTATNSLGIQEINLKRMSDGHIFYDCTFENGGIYTFENGEYIGICCFEDLL